MKVKDVVIEYHQKVSFPWTLKKVKKAGYELYDLLKEILAKLNKCEDRETASSKELIDNLNDTFAELEAIKKG